MLSDNPRSLTVAPLVCDLLRFFGVTATPYRMGQGFIYGLEDHFFGGVSYQIGIPQLIKDGYLCRLSAFKVDDQAVIDASTARVKFKGGGTRMGRRTRA